MTGVQTCALPISRCHRLREARRGPNHPKTTNRSTNRTHPPCSPPSSSTTVKYTSIPNPSTRGCENEEERPTKTHRGRPASRSHGAAWLEGSRRQGRAGRRGAAGGGADGGGSAGGGGGRISSLARAAARGSGGGASGKELGKLNIQRALARLFVRVALHFAPRTRTSSGYRADFGSALNFFTVLRFYGY